MLYKVYGFETYTWRTADEDNRSHIYIYAENAEEATRFFTSPVKDDYVYPESVTVWISSPFWVEKAGNFGDEYTTESTRFKLLDNL